MRIISVFLLLLLFLFATRTLLLLDTKKDQLELHYPNPPSKKLVFFLLGDYGWEGIPQLKVARFMEKRCKKHKKVDGIITLGDNIYPSGVSSPEDPLFQKLIEKPYKKRCLSKIPWFPALGNHDYEGNAQAQIDYSEKNPRWKMPHRFYTVTFGDFLKLIVFDSPWSDLCLNPYKCASDFLLKEIYTNKHKWLLVSSHHPLTSASSKEEAHYTGDDFLSLLLKKISCSHVDAWLAGHSHHLEQRRLPQCKTEFLINGAGGAHLNHPHLDQKESSFVKSDYGFIEIEIEEDKMTSRFFTKEGLVFESTAER